MTSPPSCTRNASSSATPAAPKTSVKGSPPSSSGVRRSSRGDRGAVRRGSGRACSLPQLRGFDRDAFAAAAGVGLVGVAEDELGGEPADLVVDLGAQQEQ